MKESKDLKEYALFIKEDLPPPPEVSERALTQIRRMLNPALGMTVFKLFWFHVVGSIVTLLFCPQQGMSIFGVPGISGYLMEIHPGLCFFACGLSWMLGGQALSYALLTIDEQRVLGGYRWLSAFSILLLSVLLFACLGTLELDLWLLLWGGGAVSVILLFNFKTVHEQKRFRLGLPR